MTNAILTDQNYSPNAADTIFVTRPDLPPLDEFFPYLQEIWNNRILTNNGPFHQKLEEKLSEYLGVQNISLFTNATIALVTAIKALEIHGEVITTPYSFVATSQSILWNGVKPVFVDIDPDTLNIDPSKIEAAITHKTKAILAVHCYGNICDYNKIQKIADRYKLKVIYDAAHAFGVRDRTGSVLKHGDLSVLSFHATKVYNTFEGGAIICSDIKMKQKIDKLKNFGFASETEVISNGINGKMSEFNAAFGLLQLQYVGNSIRKRKKVDFIYRKSLTGIKGISFPKNKYNQTKNYSYFPILIGQDYPLSRDELFEKFRSNGIYTRRYFYPLISEFPIYRNFKSASRNNLINAVDAANRIICLPIYATLTTDEQYKIINIIMSSI